MAECAPSQRPHPTREQLMDQARRAFGLARTGETTALRQVLELGVSPNVLNEKGRLAADARLLPRTRGDRPAAARTGG